MQCILFGVGPDGVDLRCPVSRWLTTFKKALEEPKAHDTKTTDQEAVAKTEHPLKVMHGKK